MAAPMVVAIPLGLDLADGYTIRFTAVDAATGLVVPNVVISGATVQYDPVPIPPDPVKNTAVFLPGPAFE